MKKIKLILSLIFFLSPTICLAKVIKIDGITFDVDEYLSLQGLYYEPATDSLTLTNANYKSIQTEEDLNITLIGNNTIENIKELECLSGKNITINGNGTLKIISNKEGIKSNYLEINNTTIYGNITNNFLTTVNDDYRLKTNNSNILFNSNKVFNVNGNIEINDTNFVIEKVNQIADDEVVNININNSSLLVLDSNDIGINIKFNINTTSKVFIKCEEELNANNFNSQDVYLGSTNNISYHELIQKGDKYLKVNFDNNYEKIELLNIKEQLDKREEEVQNMENSLVIKENNMKEKEIQLAEKENNLENKELELLELNEELNNMEEELMKKEENLNRRDEILEEQNASIEALSNILTGSYLENEIVKNNLFKEKEEIESLKKYINLKQQELANKEEIFLKNKGSVNRNTTEKDSTFVNEGGGNDDFMDGAYLYDQNDFNYLKKAGNIFYLLISYLGGVVTHIFTKRRING